MFKYGWVITSHSSPGMTSKNVAAAVEKMSGQAFYVASSRGRKNLSCPFMSRTRERMRKVQRIVSGCIERLIPWYSVLEVHVGSTFRIFELHLAGDRRMVSTQICRRNG